MTYAEQLTYSRSAKGIYARNKRRLELKTMSTKPRKTRTKTAPENETKEARFVRLATMRMDKALKAIRLIGNLSGAGYAYNEAQVTAMGAALVAASDETFARFRPGGKTAKESFTF